MGVYEEDEARSKRFREGKMTDADREYYEWLANETYDQWLAEIFGEKEGLE